MKAKAQEKSEGGVPMRREAMGSFKARSARNETPMYVRPYVEDPLWLEPDDDEFTTLLD